MKNHYKVIFQKSESIYCANILISDDIDKINEHYNKYSWHSIQNASYYDIEDAKRKNMPIIEI